MIFDNLQNCEMYYEINDKFEAAFDFIKKATCENLPVGKYELDGSELYASIQEYTTKYEYECKFEGHRNYIDIQYIISGIEVIEVVDISKAESMIEYSVENDIEFYKNTNKAGKGVVESGEYGIFFPKDLHKPGINYEEVTAVKKIVVKVKI